MPAKTKAPAKKAPKKQKSSEESLWDTANKLRGTVESSEYKHVILSLIFLKFVSDKFEARRRELIDEGKEAFPPSTAMKSTKRSLNRRRTLRSINRNDRREKSLRGISILS